MISLKWILRRIIKGQEVHRVLGKKLRPFSAPPKRDLSRAEWYRRGLAHQQVFLLNWHGCDINAA
jgi:hypothetical protein